MTQIKLLHKMYTKDLLGVFIEKCLGCGRCAEKRQPVGKGLVGSIAYGLCTADLFPNTDLPYLILYRVSVSWWLCLLMLGLNPND